MLMAPGTWARANASGERTSMSTKSGSRASVSCTSQQSVSKLNALSNRRTALALSAAGTWLTRLGMAPSVSEAARLLRASIVRRRAGRTQWRERQGTLRSRHEPQSGRAGLRPAVYLRVRLHRGAVRAAATGAQRAVVRVRGVRAGAGAVARHRRHRGPGAPSAAAARFGRYDRHSRLARPRRGATSAA